MSSFSQAIANLRNNNNARKNEAKGYNLDAAKFESQRLQDQGRLFLLAGDLGANLTKKLAARAENERINDDLISYAEKNMESYLGSDEAENASQILMKNAKDQNAMSLELSNIEAANPDLSSVTREGKDSSGKMSKTATNMLLGDTAEQWPAYYSNQLLNNTDMIEVRIPDGMGGLTVKNIPVNGANLSELEKRARLNYLTKKYLGEKGISKYNKDYLYLPQERGGSGFMLEMLKNNEVIKKAIELETKKAAAEYEIGLTGNAFTKLKSTDSLGDYLTALKGGYNTKGKIRNWSETWKEFESNMDQFLENGQFTVNEILNFSNNYKFQMNGKEMSLAEYKPGLWAPTDANGVQGKYITEAFKAKEKRSQAIILGVNQTVGQMTDGLLERVKGGEFTSETDISNGIAEIVRVSNSVEGADEVDISALRKQIAAVPTEDSNAIGDKLYEDYMANKTEFSLPLEVELQKYGPSVANNPKIQYQLALEAEAKGNLKDILEVIEKNEQTQIKNNEGVMVWQYKNATAERKYLMIEKYALNLYSENEQKTTGKLDLNQIRAQVEKYSKDNTETMGTTWENLDKQIESGIELDSELQRIKDLPFTKDSNGVYRNLNSLGLPLVSNEEVKEIREELIGANIIKPYDVANANTVIPAESKIFMGSKTPFREQPIPDYNKLLEDIGYIPDSIVDFAASQNMTTYEFLETRMKAFNKTIDTKYKKFLNGDEVSTLPSAMKNRLLGKINDGMYTNQQIPAYITKTSNLAGGALTMTFQENGEKFVQAIGSSYEALAANINDDGEFTGDAESDKALIGFMSGLGMSISPEIFNDFAEGGQGQFVEALKQNVSVESLPSLLMSPEVGFNAYSTSGDIDFLPVLDSLQETKGQDNLTKLLQKLAKFYEPTEPEEAELFTSETDPDFGHEIRTFSGTDNIDESLNNN